MWLFAILLIFVAVVIYHWRHSRFRASFTDFFLAGFTVVHSVFWKRLQRTGPHQLPDTGPAILISNHTCSADPMFLYAGCPRVLSFLVTDSHYHIHPIANRILEYTRCVPVRRGGHDVKSVRVSLRRLEEGCVLVIFPEGGLSGVAVNRPRRGKYGAAYLALKTGTPVYPAYISGGPRTDRLLPSWVKRSTRAVRVYYGPKVDLSAYQNRPITRRTLEEVTVLLMNKIGELQPASETPRYHIILPKEAVMSATNLTAKKCVPCEGGVPTLTEKEVQSLLKQTPGWEVVDNGKKIRRSWKLKNFVQCLDFFQKVGKIAEDEGHHPDLHLTGYRMAAVEVTTHAIGGLSENDFILAAKIDQVAP